MRDHLGSTLFSSIKANALQGFLYFDGLKSCNPLGSKTKKRKLGNKKGNGYEILICGCLETVEWNSGMERWNGMVE